MTSLSAFGTSSAPVPAGALGSLPPVQRDAGVADVLASFVVTPAGAETVPLPPVAGQGTEVDLPPQPSPYNRWGPNGRGQFQALYGGVFGGHANVYGTGSSTRFPIPPGPAEPPVAIVPPTVEAEYGNQLVNW